MAQKYPLFSLETADSTQAVLKRKLSGNGTLASFTTVVAKSQTAGRGRGIHSMGTKTRKQLPS